MSWRLSSRWGMTAILAAGCGDLVALGHGNVAGSGGLGGAGGNGGTSGEAATAGASNAGRAGVAGAPSGGATGSAGEPASAGAAGDASLEGYRFDLIRPPEVSPGEVPQGEKPIRGTTVGSMSQDGSLVFGSALYAYVDPENGEILANDQKSISFYWTRETGTVRFEEFAGIGCVTPDGSVAFGRLLDSNRETTGSFRWTRADGIQALVAEGGKIALLESCSSDGKTATGWFRLPEGGMIGAALWQQGVNGDAIVQIALPDQPESNESDSWLSADGSAVIVEQGQKPEAIYRWTSASGATPLGGPIASDPGWTLAWKAEPNGPIRVGDDRKLVNADASVVMATQAQEDYARWTFASGAWTPVPSLVSPPAWMSEDGLSFIGGNAGPLPAAWTEGGSTEIIPARSADGQGQIYATSHDGNVAYLSHATGSAGLDLEAVLLRWKRGQGTTLLARPPGDVGASVTACSSDGSVAVGYSWNEKNERHGLLWDEQGMRDITAELLAAGIDLENVTALMPDRVWSGSPIVVQGMGKPNYFTTIGWFAELPTR